MAGIAAAMLSLRPAPGNNTTKAMAVASKVLNSDNPDGPETALA